MSKRATFLGIAIIIIIGTIITYWNHFNNDFHFDDSHTITNNIYIRDIGNIPKFFTDMKTFGSMPDNLGYRPVVTASTAIDYWLGGGLKPFWFHFSMFIMFLLQGLMMFYMILKIFKLSIKHEWLHYLAFFSIALYMFHPGNAETINYITCRSDSYSAVFIILGMIMYIYSGICRKYLLFMIPVLAGILTKESAVMFPLFLFSYIFLFEKKVSVGDFFTGKNRQKAWTAVKAVLPALIVTLLIAFIAQYIAYSQTHNSGVLNVKADNSGYHWDYLKTQPYVLLTYFLQFMIPAGLSSDPDLAVFDSAWDIRLWVGLLFIAFMIYGIIISSKNEKTRPIAFGFLWFIIASIPTSVIAALTQVSNSHRLFLPYVGLVIAVPYASFIFIEKIQTVFKRKNFNITLVALILVILGSYAYGTRERNKVWQTEESLWYDITQKSPGNARALMNYGLARMEKADFFEAEYYFRKALKIWPNWLYLHINMGILKDAQGYVVEAEQWFLNAIQLAGNSNPEPHYYYARFLNQKGKYDNAIANLKTAIQISEAHIMSRKLLMSIYAETARWDELVELANSTLAISASDADALQYLELAKGRKTQLDIEADNVNNNPTAEGYLNLSLSYYKKGMFEKCIEACNDALKLKPDYADAYNNICSAYNAMQQWDKGIEACQKALELQPDFQLAKNNLNWAVSEKAKLEQ